MCLILRGCADGYADVWRQKIILPSSGVISRVVSNFRQRLGTQLQVGRFQVGSDIRRQGGETILINILLLSLSWSALAIRDLDLHPLALGKR